MRLQLFNFLSFLIIFGISTVISEHVTVTYHFWEKNPEIVEKVEYFTRFVANSNRFWTSNLVYLQHDEKIDKIEIASENWKSANVEDVVTYPLDDFFIQIFQKFADRLFTNKALDSLPIFDPNVFEKSKHSYDDFEVSAESEEQFKFDYWLKVAGENEGKLGEDGVRGYMGGDNTHVFALLTRKENFDHWEAILVFANVMKRSKQRGYIVDCGRPLKYNICPQTNTDVPVLYVFKDDEILMMYQGDFMKDNLYNFVLTIKQPAIKMLNEDLVPSYRSGLIPGFDGPVDTVTILFIHTKKSHIWGNYVRFAKEHHGRFHLTALVSEEVKKWSIYPAFITMKPKDDYVKAFTLHKDINWNRMAEFLADGTHPGCHPITTPYEFMYATSNIKPLILFFDPLGTKNLTQFKMAASQEQNQERKELFAAISGFDLFGLYVMSAFNIVSPSYVVITREEKGWCINTRPIEANDFLIMKTWVRNLDLDHYCQALIEDFKFPIARLTLLERYEDIDELEREMTEVERNRDEL